MTPKQKELYYDWRELVNMTPGQIESFIRSPLGKTAGLSRAKASSMGIRSGQDSARAIIRMKRKGVKNWTPSDWAWAKRQVAFIKRMVGNPGPLKKDGKPTRLLLSLKVWGHNPYKPLGSPRR